MLIGFNFATNNKTDKDTTKDIDIQDTTTDTEQTATDEDKDSSTIDQDPFNFSFTETLNNLKESDQDNIQVNSTIENETNEHNSAETHSSIKQNKWMADLIIEDVDTGNQHKIITPDENRKLFPILKNPHRVVLNDSITMINEASIDVTIEPLLTINVYLLKFNMLFVKQSSINRTAYESLSVLLRLSIINILQKYSFDTNSISVLSSTSNNTPTNLIQIGNGLFIKIVNEEIEDKDKYNADKYKVDDVDKLSKPNPPNYLSLDIYSYINNNDKLILENTKLPIFNIIKSKREFYKNVKDLDVISYNKKRGRLLPENSTDTNRIRFYRAVFGLCSVGAAYNLLNPSYENNSPVFTVSGTRVEHDLVGKKFRYIEEYFGFPVQPVRQNTVISNSWLCEVYTSDSLYNIDLWLRQDDSIGIDSTEDRYNLMSNYHDRVYSNYDSMTLEFATSTEKNSTLLLNHFMTREV